jgi:multisubunit Na+/H+ antiporter MnhC subunit
MDTRKTVLFLVTVIATFIIAVAVVVPLGVSFVAEMPPESLEYILKVNADPLMIALRIMGAVVLGCIVTIVALFLCRKTEEEVAEKARMERIMRNATVTTGDSRRHSVRR